MASQVTMAQSPLRYSVHDRSLYEAQAYKWIESEKAGHDLGESAIQCWIRTHWNGFLRARWIEHLEGRTYWIELDHDDFGFLQRAFHDSPLFHEILRRLKEGQENLEVINWAIDTRLPMLEVIDILETLDINSRRIECRLESRLAAGRPRHEGEYANSSCS